MINKIGLVCLISSTLVLAWCNSWSNSASAPNPTPVVEKVAQVTWYQPYKLASVEKAIEEGKKTAVFFHGATCGSCAKLDANIKKNVSKIPWDVAIFNADWDENQDLAVEYGVDKYHTVTMVTNGKKNVKGLFELDDLLSELDWVNQVNNNGVYAKYDVVSFDKAVEEGKKVAVFFHGATCGSCAKLDANIKENVSKIPWDVAIFNADWDENQDLAVEYGVDKYHTVTMITNGKKNVKWLFELNDLVKSL